MSVVLPQVVRHDWGWWSSDHQRMHIQTVDKKSQTGPNVIHVWLENMGVRTFQVDTKDADKLSRHEVQTLRDTVAHWRGMIEGMWTAWVIEKNWLTYSLVDDLITLSVYTVHNSFQRQLSIRQDIGLAESYAANITQDDLKLDPDHAALVLRRHAPPGRQIHVALPDVLWLDP
jgi:hypothetical protein